jgi:hypothetical protein
MDDAAALDYPRAELKTLRERLKNEQKSQLESARELEERWSRQRDAARDQLEALNKAGSRDTPEAAALRERLHDEIAGLDQSIRQKQVEQEQEIPAAFEAKLAKLEVIERWPSAQRKVQARIEEGKARDRKHGDVEDIGYRRLSEDQEEDIAPGEQAVRQMMAEGRIPREVQNEDVTAYIQGLAGRLAQNSDLNIPLHVAVLDSPDIHPITLPGGYLFLPSGLLKAAQTESELAGVMAREIARIAARHGYRQARPPLFSKIFMPIIQLAAGIFTGSVASPAAYYGISFGVQGVGSMVDRAIANAPGKYQEEADQLGMQYAWKAGFDPRGFLVFLHGVYRQQPPSDVNAKDLASRLVKAFSEMEYLPANESYDIDSAEFRLMRASL